MDQNTIMLSAAAVSVIALLTSEIKKKKRRRRIWSEKWLLARQQGRGVLNMVTNELRHEDPTAYKQFMRMCSDQFDELLSIINIDIRKLNTNMRESISSEQRLAVTLRFLATGESYRSLMFATRIHESTISIIIPEVCKIIYENLRKSYLKMPSTEEAWQEISVGFNSLWNFPLCLGAIDGKHIPFRAPRSSGSYYFNYKGAHSIVLLGIADANYKFIYVDVGVNGRISDGGVFRNSSFKKAMEKDILNFPADQSLPGINTLLPFTLVADDAFPLMKRVMKPFRQRGLTNEKRIYNYRLSRARRVVENAFGILANRFRVLLSTINLSPDKVEKITLACCVLHNFLASKNPKYIELENDWKTIPSIGQHQGANRTPQEALDIREQFTKYFINDGAVSWQDQCLN